jgi:hypothetical protein
MHQGKRNRDTIKSVSGEIPAPVTKAKKAYHAPVLEQYGDLESLTKGVGNGSGDGTGGPMSMNTCWIAEVLYGVDDSRTLVLRRWLANTYSRTMTGSVVVALYRAFGKRVASWVRRSALLRRVLIPLFDAGVTAALRHYTLAAR